MNRDISIVCEEPGNGLEFASRNGTAARLRNAAREQESTETKISKAGEEGEPEGPGCVLPSLIRAPQQFPIRSGGAPRLTSPTQQHSSNPTAPNFGRPGSRTTGRGGERPNSSGGGFGLGLLPAGSGGRDGDK
jgi:hypothetical protein